MVVRGHDDQTIEAEPLAGAGSNRQLWRIGGSGRTAVLVLNAAANSDWARENDSFVYLAGHLRERGLPVPEVYGHEPSLGAYIMEDLGDMDLYSWLKSGPGAEDILGLYGEAVTLLARLQTAALEGFDPSRCLAPGARLRRTG